MNSLDYANIIQETREVLRKRRGWWGRVHAEDCFQAMPSKSDDLRSHLDTQRLLLKKGKVVWAALVQANSKLYQLDDHWYPGEVLCSVDAYFDAHADELDTLAVATFQLKGACLEDAELRPIADRLTDELTRVAGVPLPPSFLAEHTAGENVRAYSVIFDRHHLPDRVLAERLMPVLHHPQVDHVMVLPASAWGPGMRALWELADDTRQQLLEDHKRREQERIQRPMVVVSNSAVAKIKQIGVQNDMDLFVRIEYQHGHSLAFVDRDSVNSQDRCLTVEGITFLMDAQSADAIWGCRLSWNESDAAAGFAFA